MRFTCVLLAALLAGCGKSGSSSSSSGSASSSGWKAIEGGKECRFAGVCADVPGSWTVTPQGNATILVPPGVNPGAPDEIYAFVGDPSIKSLDAAGLEPYMDATVSQLLRVPAQRKGSAEKFQLGALAGRTWAWTAKLMDGRDVEVRSWAFEGSYTGALVAVATPAALQSRMREIEQILGSFRKPESAAISSTALCTTWVRAFGSHTALTGNANEQQITFYPNGRFHYHSEGTSHGVFHTGSSQTDLDGSWTLSGDQLTGAVDGGESRTMTLEARTEAGTGAATIAIDGTEFRQIDGRAW